MKTSYKQQEVVALNQMDAKEIEDVVKVETESVVIELWECYWSQGRVTFSCISHKWNWASTDYLLYLRLQKPRCFLAVFEKSLLIVLRLLLSVPPI